MQQLGSRRAAFRGELRLGSAARAVEVSRAMADRGVLVRAFTAMPRDLPEFAESNGAALRIGVGPWEMMQTLLDVLREVLACT